MSVVGGVRSDGSVIYQDAADPEFQQDFGIGPGCESTSGRAVPPARLLALAEAFAVDETPSVFSICDDDYGPALEAIAESIADQLRPACMPACVADSDPTTERLDPTCTIEYSAWSEDGTIATWDVLPCEGGSVPADQDICWVPQTGEDLHEYCRDLGLNLEVELVYRPGFAVPRDGLAVGTCTLSQERSVDCPELR